MTAERMRIVAGAVFFPRELDFTRSRKPDWLGPWKLTTSWAVDANKPVRHWLRFMKDGRIAFGPVIW